MTNLITSIWSLDGVTVNKNNTFSYLGDYDEDSKSYYLYFNLDSSLESPLIKRIKIKEPLRYISSDVKDYIKDGVVYRNIGVFETNKNTFFEIDNNAWDNSGDTFGFYLSNPLLIKKESKVKCNKLNTLTGSITKGSEIGIKCYENIIGIRVLKADAGITDNMTIKEMKLAIANYLNTNKLTILYELVSKNYESLEDYAFTLKDYNNNIINVNTNPPDYFHIEYPVEIIINNTIDIEQILQIQASISNTLNTVINLKSEVENYKKSIDSTATEISDLKVSIDSKDSQIASSLEQVTQIEISINQLNQDVVNKLNDINHTLDEINELKVYFDSINNNISAFEDKLNNSIASIEPGAESNTLLVTKQNNEQVTITIPVDVDLSNYYTKENIDSKVSLLNDKIEEVANAEIDYEKIDTSKLIFNTDNTDLVATNISQVIKELNTKITILNETLSPITNEKINELCD